jgi:hypothetical protein
MMQHFKQQWQQLKASPPGRRFKELQKRRKEHGFQRQPWLPIVGVLLIVIGIALLVLPGPGVIFIIAGLGFLAQEFPFMARFLDATELRLRSWFRLHKGSSKSRSSFSR